MPSTRPARSSGRGSRRRRRSCGGRAASCAPRRARGGRCRRSPRGPGATEAGFVSAANRAPSACAITTASECATTSCTSRAMRFRSSSISTSRSAALPRSAVSVSRPSSASERPSCRQPQPPPSATAPRRPTITNDGSAVGRRAPGRRRARRARGPPTAAARPRTGPRRAPRTTPCPARAAPPPSTAAPFADGEERDQQRQHGEPERDPRPRPPPAAARARPGRPPSRPGRRSRPASADTARVYQRKATAIATASRRRGSSEDRSETIRAAARRQSRSAGRRCRARSAARIILEDDGGPPAGRHRATADPIDGLAPCASRSSSTTPST